MIITLYRIKSKAVLCICLIRNTPTPPRWESLRALIDAIHEGPKPEVAVIPAVPFVRSPPCYLALQCDPIRARLSGPHPIAPAHTSMPDDTPSVAPLLPCDTHTASKPTRCRHGPLQAHQGLVPRRRR